MLLSMAAAARAGEPAQPPPIVVGKLHFDKGVQLYRAGKYADAIGEFESGYAAFPRPAFLLNIAQAWRKLGDLGWARLYYQRFVDQADPDDPARAAAQEALARLNGPEPLKQSPKPEPALPVTRLDNGPPKPAPPPPVVTPAPAPAPLPPPHAARRRAVGWIGVAAGVLGLGALGAGAGLMVDAQALNRQYLHPPDGAHFNPEGLHRRDVERDAAIGLFAGGGALVAVGVSMAVIHLSPRPPSRHALAPAPLWTPTAMGVSLAGTF
jgi:hypothetical protein